MLVGGQPVALFNVQGTFHALDGRCPHRGGPLGQGFLDGSRFFPRRLFTILVHDDDVPRIIEAIAKADSAPAVAPDYRYRGFARAVENA
mgnify:CR=1 FL=1